MAILHHDGFDAAATGGGSMTNYLSRMGYVSAGGTATTGRTGSGIASNAGGWTWPLGSSPSTVVVGIGVQRTIANTTNIVELQDGVGAQINVRSLADGTVEIRRGDGSGTLLQTTAAGVLLINIWYYLEVKVLVSDSVGTWEVRLDGVAILSGTGADTKQQTSATVTKVMLGSGGTSVDDVYILDTTGSSPWNDFLGPVQSLARMPTSEGTTIEWTPSTGTDNSALVDDVPANDDTDYNSTAAAANLDLLNHADAPVGSTIVCVSQRALARKTDAGVASLKLVAYVSATEYADSGQAIPDSYAYIKRIYQVNPNTTAQWDLSGVNGAEFGYESN